MSFIEAFVLGVVQGLTEFLPVSSSGHLVLADALLGLETPGVLVVIALHVATLLAVCWVYRRRIGELVGGLLRADRESLVYIGLLVLASVPAAVIGIGFLDLLGGTFERPVVAATLLLVTGVIVWTLRYSARRTGYRDQFRAIDAVGIGLAQALALLPGISRSGSTVAMGAGLGLDPGRVAEFSFLMSVPAIGGAAILQAPELSAAGATIGAAPLAVAFVAALGSGVFAIRWFVSMLVQRTFHRFAYYCWAVGALYLLAAWLEPGLR
ncbi:MAG: undecaprenyl-diphosphate phosphatase [Gemmatimonadota bacterium]|nr:undecaprenyl-diphosphate phosphatase [Gemmatimonadota bacterium]